MLDHRTSVILAVTFFTNHSTLNFQSLSSLARAALGPRALLCYKPRPHSPDFLPAPPAVTLPRTSTMHNFKRAFKVAFSHRVNVVSCVVTAVIIAVLWGGNLTAVFPVVEVIMNDHSLPEWIDQKTDEAQHEVRDAQRWLAQLQKIKDGDPQEIKRNI